MIDAGNLRFRISADTKQAENSLQRLQNLAETAFVVAGLANFIRSIIDSGVAMERFERTMLAATGSAILAGDSLKYVIEQSNLTGVNLESAAGSFAKLMAAAKGTAVEGEGARRIFEGLNNAIVGLGLSSERSELVYTAMIQMLSKGRVQMEELRNQLGDSLPGVVSDFARSMNVSVQEFEKLVEAGKVRTPEILVFAEFIGKKYEEAAKQAAGSYQAALNRMRNAAFEAKNEVFDSGFGDGLIKTFEEVTALFKDEGFLEAARNIGFVFGEAFNGLAAAIRFARENSEALLITLGMMSASKITSSISQISSLASPKVGGMNIDDMRIAQDEAVRSKLGLATDTQKAGADKLANLAAESEFKASKIREESQNNIASLQREAALLEAQEKEKAATKAAKLNSDAARKASEVEFSTAESIRKTQEMSALQAANITDAAAIRAQTIQQQAAQAASIEVENGNRRAAAITSDAARQASLVRESSAAKIDAIETIAAEKIARLGEDSAAKRTKIEQDAALQIAQLRENTAVKIDKINAAAEAKALKARETSLEKSRKITESAAVKASKINADAALEAAAITNNAALATKSIEDDGKEKASQIKRNAAQQAVAVELAATERMAEIKRDTDSRILKEEERVGKLINNEKIRSGKMAADIQLQTAEAVKRTNLEIAEITSNKLLGSAKEASKIASGAGAGAAIGAIGALDALPERDIKNTTKALDELDGKSKKILPSVTSDFGLLSNAIQKLGGYILNFGKMFFRAIGGLPGLIAGAGLALYAFRDQTIEVGGEQVRLGDIVKATWETAKMILGGAIDGLVERAKNAAALITDIFGAVSGALERTGERIMNLLPDSLQVEWLAFKAMMTPDEIPIASEATSTIEAIFQAQIAKIESERKASEEAIKQLAKDQELITMNEKALADAEAEQNAAKAAAAARAEDMKKSISDLTTGLKEILQAQKDARELFEASKIGEEAVQQAKLSQEAAKVVTDLFGDMSKFNPTVAKIINDSVRTIIKTTEELNEEQERNIELQNERARVKSDYDEEMADLKAEISLLGQEAVMLITGARNIEQWRDAKERAADITQRFNSLGAGAVNTLIRISNAAATARGAIDSLSRAMDIASSGMADIELNRQIEAIYASGAANADILEKKLVRRNEIAKEFEQDTRLAQVPIIGGLLQKTAPAILQNISDKVVEQEAATESARQKWIETQNSVSSSAGGMASAVEDSFGKQMAAFAEQSELLAYEIALLEANEKNVDKLVDRKKRHLDIEKEFAELGPERIEQLKRESDLIAEQTEKLELLRKTQEMLNEVEDIQGQIGVLEYQAQLYLENAKNVDELVDAKRRHLEIEKRFEGVDTEKLKRESDLLAQQQERVEMLKKNREEMNKMSENIELNQKVAQIYQQIPKDAEELIEKLKFELELRKELAEVAPEFRNVYEQLARNEQLNIQQAEELKKRYEEVRDIGREIGDSFTSAFEDFVYGAESAKEAVKGLILEISKMYFRRNVLAPIGNFFENNGSFFTDILGFATGGSVIGNEPILVGESGPEIIIPKTASTVVPNNRIGNTNGSGNVNVTINIQTPNPAAMRESMGQISAKITDAVNAGRRMR